VYREVGGLAGFGTATG